MNILDKSAIRECTSCQLCAAVCAHNAINIKLNEDGFYRPVINTDLCTDCGLCTKFCYKFDKVVNMTTNEQLDRGNLYAAWANDDVVVKNTTSGGIGDLLACQLQKEGYKIVGCIYNEEKVRAEHRIANSEEDRLLFRGSKYMQSYTIDVLKEIVSTCKTDKYAVFGTPCQIYALSKWATLLKKRDNFFFVDLYCHGCPSFLVWNKYQQHIKDKLNIKKFDQVVFRSKVCGWGTFYIIEFKIDGKTAFKSSPRKNYFYDLFFSDQVLNDACNKCLLRGTHEYTDIRLGDFWGKKFIDNHRGVSAVSVISERGKRVFERIKEMDVSTICCKYDEFLPFQSWGKVHNPNANIREAIISNLRNPRQTIVDAAKVLYCSQSIKQKLVRYIKYVLSFLPINVTNIIKKMM